MMMDMNQMYYFKKIVESDCNLTEASKRIHISQSALSQFIGQLEESQSISIFERKHNRLISLTPAGEIIYDSVTKILKQYEEMLNQIKDIQEGDQITLYFGATSSYPQTLLPEFFTQFALQHSNIHVNLVENGAVNIHERFLNAEFDFALLVEPIVIPEGFAETRRVFNDELAAFMSDAHPLAGIDKVTWEQIANYPIVTLNEDYGTHKKVLQAFKSRGLEANFVFFSSAWQYLIDSIKKDSKTITIMPYTTPTFAKSDHIITKAFAEREQFTIVLAKRLHKKESRAIRMVERMLLAHLPSIDAR